MKISPQQLDGLKKTIAQGKTIFAIKEYRAITGADLMTAKLFIDELVAQNNALNSLSKKVEGQECFNHQQMQLMADLLAEEKRDDAIAMYMHIKHDGMPNVDEFKAGLEFINQLPRYIQDYDITQEHITDQEVTEKVKQQKHIKEPDKQKSTEQSNETKALDYAFEWLSDETAPKLLNNFLDANIPLMDKSQFVPINEFSRFILAYKISITALLVIASYSVIAGILQSNPNPSSLIAWVFLLGFPAITLFYTWKTWKFYKQSIQAKQGVLNDYYRQGMFVLKDGLLLHKKNKFCYIPKTSISKFKLTTYPRRHVPTTLDVHVQMADDSMVSYRLNFLKQLNTPLHKALQQWHKTGYWEYH